MTFFTVIPADSELDGELLSQMHQRLFPEQSPIPAAEWKSDSIESYWFYEDQRLAGMIVLERHATVADTYHEDSPPEPGTLYLLFIGCEAGCRGRGLGTKAMAWVVDYARRSDEFSSVVSNLRASNVASESLHLRSGFTPVGRKTCYYEDPAEDCIVMRIDVS